MKFRILIHKRAYEFLKDLKPEEKQRIVDKLKQLEDFPTVRLDIVKIAGETDTFRLRIGNYRALFKVYEQEKIIVVAKIDVRKGFADKLKIRWKTKKRDLRRNRYLRWVQTRPSALLWTFGTVFISFWRKMGCYRVLFSLAPPSIVFGCGESQKRPTLSIAFEGMLGYGV